MNMRMCLAMLSALMVVGVTADNLTIAAGETKTISASATYDNVYVSGKLTDRKVTLRNGGFCLMAGGLLIMVK